MFCENTCKMVVRLINICERKLRSYAAEGSKNSVPKKQIQ